MRRPRTIPLALATLSIVVMLGAVVLMARRIVDYNATQGRATYVQYEVTDNRFSYNNLPVTIEDIPATAAAEHGSVRITFGDDALVLPVTIPPNQFADNFPGLERHADWMRLVRFAELTGRDYNQLMQAIGEGKEDDRLVLVTKSIRPGVNPETWGKVWRKDWMFDFYEFLPEGGFRHERFAYPHARSAEQQEALRQAEGDGGVPELNTRSWQFQMAHLLMPEGSSPRIIAGDSPLVAVGWVFPVGVFSVLAATAFLLLAFAPQRTTQTGSEPDPAQPSP